MFPYVCVGDAVILTGLICGLGVGVLAAMGMGCVFAMDSGTHYCALVGNCRA